MEIWIQSQDKRHLKKVNDILVFNSKFIPDEIVCYRPNDKDFLIKCDNLTFGRFTTKEQAMQVIEDIKKLIQPKMIIKFNSLKSQKDLQRYQDATDRIVLNNTENIEYILTEKFYQIPEDKIEVWNE